MDMTKEVIKMGNKDANDDKEGQGAEDQVCQEGQDTGNQLRAT